MTDNRAVLVARLRHVLAGRLAAVVVARQNIVVCTVTAAGNSSLLRPLTVEVLPAGRLVRP